MGKRVLSRQRPLCTFEGGSSLVLAQLGLVEDDEVEGDEEEDDEDEDDEDEEDDGEYRLEYL